MAGDYEDEDFDLSVPTITAGDINTYDALPDTLSGDWWDTPAAKNLLGLGTSAAVQFLGGNDPKVEKAGYQGGIPDYVASRTAVPGTNNPARRPGSGGQRYFTDINFKGPTADTAGLAALNAANPSLESSSPAVGGLFASLRSPASNRVYDSFEGFTGPKTPYEAGVRHMGAGISLTPEFKKYLQESGYSIDETPMGTDRPTVIYNPQGQQVTMTNRINPRPPENAYTQMYAGGIAQLNSGAYLNGATDGMADRIPATIEGSQEARLSDGEFVIPADVVGGLGNGNSSAGAKTLYNMMDRVRMARTGTKKQGTQINPNKMMPV